MNELENIILIIDTREHDQNRVSIIQKFFEQNGAIVEKKALPLCDYQIIGEFRKKGIDIGIEYKSWDNFILDDHQEMKNKIARAKDIYEQVGFFIETGNYEIVPQPDNQCKIFVSDNTGRAMFEAGCETAKASKSLSQLEGFCDTLQVNSIHVRQLRSVYHFPYAVWNLLTYLLHPHYLVKPTPSKKLSEKEKKHQNFKRQKVGLPEVSIEIPVPVSTPAPTLNTHSIGTLRPQLEKWFLTAHSMKNTVLEFKGWSSNHVFQTVMKMVETGYLRRYTEKNETIYVVAVQATKEMDIGV